MIRIRRTLTRNKGRLLLGEPKATRNRRTMRFTQTAEQALSEYLKRQPHEIELLGDLY